MSSLFALPDSCTICQESLVIASTEDEGPSAIVDDVELLPCRHHFHWSCIMEYEMGSTASKGLCPHCNENALDPQGRFLVTVRNEGGTTENFDLGKEIEEEIYLDSNPHIRRQKAFFSLLQFGEFDEVEEMLQGVDEGGDGSKMDPDVGFEGGQTTALHLATTLNNVQAIRLLLSYGADVRRKNDEGQTAIDIATSLNAHEALSVLLEYVPS
jgi:hypothetical protein